MTDVYMMGPNRGLQGVPGDTGAQGVQGLVGLPGPAGALVYNAGGAVANAKIWSAVVNTDANGRWSVNYAAAGFIAVPRVSATAFGPGTTAADIRNADLTAVNATAASGIVSAPALSVLGIITVSLVGANVPVHIIAVGE